LSNPVSDVISIVINLIFARIVCNKIIYEEEISYYNFIKLLYKIHKRDTYFGAYIKHVTKEVYSGEKNIVFIPISYDRNFKGNAFAIGATGGIEMPVAKRWFVDFNFQLGGGLFYKMTDKFTYSLPNDNFLDYRMACWVGYRL